MQNTEQSHWEALSKLPSFERRLFYAKEHLLYVGGGSGRKVFALDEKMVIKIAKNGKGIAQNKEEIAIGDSYCSPDIVARIGRYAEGGTLLEMERAEKVSYSEFEKLAGIGIARLADYLSYFGDVVLGRGAKKFAVPTRPTGSDETEQLSIAQDLCDLAGAWNFALPGDFGRLSSYGKVMREGSATLVVVDYGYHGDAVALY